MSDALSFVEQARRDNLAALMKSGVAPFAYRYQRSHLCGEAALLLADGETEGEAVSVAGRIVAWRAHGKSIFAHLADHGGRIQLYFKADALGDAYASLAHFDLGDVVGAEGPLMRTRTGEVTVKVERVTMLAKSLRPLPFGKEETVEGRVIRHSGLSDGEQRSRQRYADLAVHAEVRRLFRARSKMTTAVRSYLDGLGYLEVETPVLQPLYGGAAATPFSTHHQALDVPLFLRIADELYLKRLIVGGMDRVYEIGHDFRNEGIDRTHNPEFTMLEFYEAYADYELMMQRVQGVLRSAWAAVDAVLDPAHWTVAERRGADADAPRVQPHLDGEFARLEWVPSLSKALGIADVTTLSDAELRRAAEQAGVHAIAALSRPKLMDELFQHHVERHIDAPTFVVDYPKALSPLAKPHRTKAGLTERFELFARGTEIANAFSELNDPIDQRERFEAQAALQAAGDTEAAGVDEDYLRALEYGLPPTGGVGIGMDRLFMYLTGTAHIRDVILFPAMRPE